MSASAVAATATALVVTSRLLLVAEADTFTASVEVARMSPSKASVSVASVAKRAPPDTAEMEAPGTSVASSKSAAATPSNQKLDPCSRTRRVAPCRLASASAAGLVDAIAAPKTNISNWSEARSPALRFVSASCAFRKTNMLPMPVGVPQTVRGAVAHEASVPGGKSPAAQPPASVPVASNFRPRPSPATA